MTLQEALEYLQGDFWDWLSESPSHNNRDLEALQRVFDELKPKPFDGERRDCGCC